MRFLSDMSRFLFVFLAMLGDSDEAQRLRTHKRKLSAKQPTPSGKDEQGSPRPQNQDSKPQRLFRYHVRLLNPHITMPVNDLETDNITMDLGEVDVRNVQYYVRCMHLI